MIEIISSWTLWTLGEVQEYLAKDCGTACNKSCSTTTLASYNAAEEMVGGIQLMQQLGEYW